MSVFCKKKKLQKIFKDIINEMRTPYVRGRYIEGNGRLMLIFSFCESENMDENLLFLDFEEAFNSGEQIFLKIQYR